MLPVTGGHRWSRVANRVITGDHSNETMSYDESAGLIACQRESADKFDTINWYSQNPPSLNMYESW